MKRALLALLTTAALGGAWGQTPERPLTCDQPGDPLHAVAFTEAPADYTDAERACWVDWTQARALADGPGGQWVDVRETGAVRRLGLPGATAVNTADLADKAFLKGRTLVLVGTGVDLKALSSRCVDLRDSAQFKGVHVLLGGVRTWQQANQPVLADGSALPAQEASAQELWLGATGDLWQVAALGLSTPQMARLPVQRERLLDLGADPSRAMARLARHLQDERLPAPRQWLVIADTPERLAQARSLWRQRADGAQAPLWLAGAWPAYASYLEQQKTLAAHAGRPLPRLCGM